MCSPTLLSRLHSLPNPKSTVDSKYGGHRKSVSLLFALKGELAMQEETAGLKLSN